MAKDPRLDPRRWSTVHPTTDAYKSWDDFEKASSEYIKWKRAGETGPAPQTFLGILIDEERRLVVRGTAQAEFGGYDIPWRMFLAMYRSTTAYVSSKDLIGAGWPDPEGFMAIDTHVQDKISELRKILDPISLTVANKRNVGYRLEINSQNF